MTGAELCRWLLRQRGITACVVTGPFNHYVPGERLIVLRLECYRGTSNRHLTLAAHECGHAEQEHNFGWLAPALRWLLAGRLLLEWDASRRARCMMAAAGIDPCEEALRNSWRSYLVPALWQSALMVALMIGALLLKWL